MEKDPFKEYMKESEPDKAGKSYVWSTAIGLQAVDGLKTSEYLLHTAISGTIQPCRKDTGLQYNQKGMGSEWSDRFVWKRYGIARHTGI